jgi:protein-L-isoaspartate(D-aspartate) O-methyltransferase
VIEGDAIDVMTTYKDNSNAVFFIDPPYTASGKKAGSRLYRYCDLNHSALFELAASLSGEFLMTYDDAEGVRELAMRSKFDMELVAMKNTHHAKMTELLLAPGPLTKVLEIGTGCGYQTAILAQLIDHVYTVERIQPLQKKAKNLLWSIKIKNVSYLHSDGGWGWEEHAPYDGIMVTAAPPEIPENLLIQMAVGGTMLIPIGKAGGQVLQRVTRTENDFKVEAVEPVSFVPLLPGRQ